jgi:hypothetical protein
MDLEQTLISLSDSVLIFQLDFFSDLSLSLPHLLAKEVDRGAGTQP